ncbi:MAG: leucine-rich repeat protein [Bacteroidaceae bacterium]|nr:leucine-rich repeat protein [Bacteroidaceae bacterium]
MWKKLFILVMVLSIGLCAWSADGDKFQAETPGGVMMEFMVISEAEKTCAVASNAIDYATKGVVTVPEEVKGYKVTEIQPNSFGNSYYITSVSLPNTLTAIGSSAFSGCTSLTAITLPASLTAIGSSAFCGCTSLTAITLPASLTAIGSSAFSRCTSLTAITLPASLKTIGTNVFYGCSSMKRVYSLMEKPIAISSPPFDCNQVVLIVPKGAREEYNNSSGWKNAVVFEDGDKIYDKVYNDQQGFVYTLKEKGDGYSRLPYDYNYVVTGNIGKLPKEVTIPSYADGCPVVQIGYTLTECEDLENLTLPSLLSELYCSCFENCVSLKEIVCPIQDPTQVYVSTSSEITQRVYLRVPDGTKSAYLSTSGWASFMILEQSEPMPNYERTLTDEQGVKYQLSQTDSSYFYTITGYAETLNERVTIPDSIGGLAVASIKGNAFQNCKTLKWIHLPALVVESPNVKSAFNGSELTLSLNNKVIHRYKFESATFIKELELGADVDSLGYGAFSSCKNLTKVTFSDQTRIIGEKSFENCLSLTTIELPQKLTSIGPSAFYGCSALTSIHLPDSLASIGGRAFSDCSKLNLKELPTNLVSIGDYAFSACTIDSVSVRERMDLSSSTFTNCTINAVSVHTKVFGYWFCNNTSIKKVYIGKEVETIGSSIRYNHSLDGCSGIEMIKVDTANIIFDSREDCNSIIKTATNYLIVGCKTSIIPKSITSIGGSAFYGCTGLTSIELPASLKSIETSAFSNCTNIQNVVSHIRKPFRISAFPAEVLSTATLTVPYGRTVLYRSVGGWNFQTIKEMEGTYEESTFIQFADSLTKDFCVKTWDENKDGELSLYEASLVTSLKNISIANDIVSFDELKYFENLSDIGTAFQSRTNLSSIALPNSVTAIGTQAFRDSKALTSIQLPNSLETIGEYAFYNCKALSTIQIPESVQSLGKRVFENCSGLTSATLPKGLKSIPAYLFLKCSALAEVVLPDSLEIIGGSAFKECASLTQISLPEGLSVLSGGAFDGSGLKEMVLPSTLTQIGDYALAGSVIHCPIKEPISVKYPSRDARNTVLYVPEESVDAYRNASGWKDFIVIAESNGNTDWTEGQIVVNVESAGGLRMALLERDEEEIRRLKICGPLNSIDLQYLAEGKGVISNLESIDLSEVTLIYDGGCYRSYTYEDPDVMWSYNKYSFFLTEETSEEHGSNIMSNTDYHYYYGPDLAGLFMDGPYKHIVMPRGITRAASHAFSECANLQEVEFANWLKYVASSAFAGCVSLPTLNLEEVDSIGASAFSRCRTLNVENMNKVRHIGNNAFNKCDFLKGSNGVVSLPLCDSIGAGVFLGCSKIEKIELSENLRFLGKQAFMNCASLTSVNLPSSLQALFEETFSGCTALKEVSYSDNLLKVHYNAFNNTPWYENLPVEGGVKYMGNIAMYVVDTQNAAGIREGTTSIADGFNSLYLSDFSLPTSLRRIGDYALRSYNLSTLLLPEGLEEIGEEAFYNNQQLTKVTLNEKLKEVGRYAFRGCSQLALVNYNAINLQATDLFSNCTSLEKVNVGAKVRILPEGIFKGCENLAIVKFAERTDDTPFMLGDYVFSGCGNLTSLDLPATTTKIGGYAFSGCSRLSTLNLPSTTTEIGEYAFSECYNIQNFIVPEQVTVLNKGVFEGCLTLFNIVLPDGLKIIGDEAFSDCQYLNTPELPEGLDSIGKAAFYRCYCFTEFTIPSTVTRMGDGILKDCYRLQKINSRIEHPMETEGIVSLSSELIRDLYNLSSGSKLTWDHIDEMYSKIVLTVPAGCKKLYRQTADWSKFADIVEEGDDTPEKNFMFAVIDTIPAGFMTQLDISLTNDRENFTAYQFDIILPIGIELETDENESSKVVMSDRNDASHTVMVEQIEDKLPSGTKRNCYRFICLSALNAPIKGTGGRLLGIPLITDADMEPGVYEARLENIIFTQQDGTENELLTRDFNITLTEAPDFILGDANGDGSITVSDIVSVINYIMYRTEGNFNKEAADVNYDGGINVSDVVKIVNLIMNK